MLIRPKTITKIVSSRVLYPFCTSNLTATMLSSNADKQTIIELINNVIELLLSSRFFKDKCFE
ncbi:hypothetical protein D3C72_1910290 [compost metagenome]